MTTLRSVLVVAAFAAGLVAPSAVRAQPRPPGQARDAATDAARSPEETARRAAVVARVEGGTLTVGEFEDLLNEAPPPIRQTFQDPARRREYLERLVQTMLLAEEARRRGLERDPQVAGNIRRILSRRVEQSLILEAVTPETITDAEVAAYYRDHLSDYQQPEYRRATVVITRDRAQALAALAELRRARMDMRRVREVVRQSSVDEDSRAHEGDVFYFQRTGASSGAEGRGVDAALAAAVFTLPREMEPTPQPVALSDGRFGVAVLTGIRPALQRNLNDPGVSASIRGFIVRERRTQRETSLLEELRARLQPEVHEDLVDAIRLPPSDLGTLPPYDTRHAPH